MLGAFLWGKRAESQLISHSNAQGKIELTASHDGYSPAKHIRKYEFDGESVLTITDRVENLNWAIEYRLITFSLLNAR